jgi:hypothetical protein
MPVRRYNDLEAAERDLWLDASDPSLGEHIRQVWSFAEHFAVRAASGVTRVRLAGGASRLAGDAPRAAPHGARPAR